jgi:hypothetical protein
MNTDLLRDLENEAEAERTLTRRAIEIGNRHGTFS